MEPENSDPGEGFPDEDDESTRTTLARVLASEITGPVFGLPFFMSVLKSRLMRHCNEVGPDVPQVLLHLAEGSVLDLCHIVELSPKWIAAAVFRDDADSCDKMDVEFVPYELIIRVTLTGRSAEGPRRLGFDVNRSVAALEAATAPT